MGPSYGGGSPPRRFGHGIATVPDLQAASTRTLTPREISPSASVSSDRPPSSPQGVEPPREIRKGRQESPRGSPAAFFLCSPVRSGPVRFDRSFVPSPRAERVRRDQHI